MLVNLRALLGVIVDIVLLRRGPENMPASSGALMLIVAAYVGVSTLFYSFMPGAPVNWGSQLLVGTIVSLLWFQVAFGIVKKTERFVQTASAYFGVYTFFLPALIPLVVTLLPFIEKPDPAAPPPTGLTLLAGALGIWLLTVQVRIVRAAFEWPYFAAIVFIFGLNVAAALVYGTLFGIPAAAA